MAHDNYPACVAFVRKQEGAIPIRRAIAAAAPGAAASLIRLMTPIVTGRGCRARKCF